MNERGIDFLYYHQVDNPLAIVVDPAYLGWHALEGADVSTKVVAKSGPEEKMGVAVDVDGLTQIIEYSDLPKEAAHRLNAAGELELWAGSTAIHIFSREFLNRLTAAQWNLPFHVAHKAVPHMAAETGDIVAPKEPNAYKFERFIFDVLPEARKALVVEADRKREFAPLKNASGVHSADDVKCSLVAVFRDWLTTAGVKIPADTAVEISPLVAIDAPEFAAKVQSGLQPVKSDAGLLWKA
jgi:UDP-N-acetylglucosamine/UDP-N-acetylgalactosamine diphosphorylase